MQNGYFVIAMLLANRAAGPATWSRVTEHWDELLARFPGTLVTRMLESARLVCKDQSLAEQVGAFLATHPVPTGEKAIAQTIERLGINSAFAERLATQAGTELQAGTERLTARREAK